MKVLIIPGLNDGPERYRESVDAWEQQYGIVPVVETVDWGGSADRYAADYVKIRDRVKSEKITAMIGISAGAAMALELLDEGVVDKVVLIAGRFGQRSISYYMLRYTYLLKYPAFLRALARLREIDIHSHAERILTISDGRDFIVRTKRLQIPGATNLVVNAGGSYLMSHVTISRQGLRVAEKEIVAWLHAEA